MYWALLNFYESQDYGKSRSGFDALQRRKAKPAFDIRDDTSPPGQWAGSEVHLGEGQAHVSDCMEALAKHGYQGDFIVEREIKENDFGQKEMNTFASVLEVKKLRKQFF